MRSYHASFIDSAARNTLAADDRPVDAAPSGLTRPPQDCVLVSWQGRGIT